MHKAVRFVVAGTLICLLAAGAQGHFQLIEPSRPIVMPADGRAIQLDLRFTHPMAGGPVMEMGEPTRFGVMVDGRTTDLKPSLTARKTEGRSTYQAKYTLRRPGDHVFFIEPSPYWEPAEGKMIVHYTKVIVDGFGAGGGWDEMVGLPVEIEPLVRPYGLWTGNCFRGVVRRDGEPVPFAEIEVEYLNDGGEVDAPAPAFETQVIKADVNGTFSYCLPRAGWWGFAALVAGDEPMESPDGEAVPVELGGLIWVHATDME